MVNQKIRHKNEKIFVKADPEIQDLIPGFLKNQSRDLILIPEALERKDFDAIRTVAHGMKGAGSGYGFEAISEMGSKMEQAALAKNEVEIQKRRADRAESMLADYRRTMM